MLDDEKGYVMSGLGMLLVIPLIFLVPTAIYMQSLSADSPTTFVKSDTVFRGFQNIQNDIENNVNNFTGSIYGKKFSNYGLLANIITQLYNQTKEKTYDGGNPVDQITLAPYPDGSPGSLCMNNISGTIPLRNGIKLTYSYMNQTSMNSEVVNQYNMNVTVNIKLSVTKVDTGHNDTISRSYGPYAFFVLSSSSDSFFTSLRTSLTSYC